MPTLAQATKRLEKVLLTPIEYDEENKAEFGAASVSFLKAWMKQNAVTGSVHWNRAGIAVSGEVMLQNDAFEVWISASSLTILPAVMYRSRTCNGEYNCGSKKLPSYKTGPNCWATPTMFASLSIDQLLKWVNRPSYMCGTKFL